MWIDKAAENSYGLHNLFEEYLDRDAFHKIKIVGKKRIGEEEVYVVKATQYIKDIEKTFYFGDFSVGVDMMENPNYVRKERDVLNDVGWYLIMSSKLGKQDGQEYKAQAREYQLKKLEDDLELIKQFYGKRKTKKRNAVAEEQTDDRPMYDGDVPIYG